MRGPWTAPHLPAPATRRAATLVEVLTCMAILALLVMPLLEMFVTGKKMMASGRERMEAMSLASSYVASLATVPPVELVETAAVEDRSLSGALSLARLGIPPAPKDYRRLVSIMGLGNEADTPVRQVTVTVQWTSRVSKAPVSYSLVRLLL